MRWVTNLGVGLAQRVPKAGPGLRGEGLEERAVVGVRGVPGLHPHRVRVCSGE